MSDRFCTFYKPNTIVTDPRIVSWKKIVHVFFVDCSKSGADDATRISQKFQNHNDESRKRCCLYRFASEFRQLVDNGVLLIGRNNACTAPFNERVEWLPLEFSFPVLIRHCCFSLA
jgi:hypothetical protein